MAQATFAFVESPQGNKVFSNVDSAYEYAQNGDFIYLSGGIFTLDDGISKTVHFVGSGFDSDSSSTTGFTKMNGGSQFHSINYVYGNGVTLDGIYIMDGLVDDSSNLVVSTCYLPYFASINGNGQNNRTATLNNCDVTGMDPRGFQSLSINKSILVNDFGYGNYIANNCVFIVPDSNGRGLGGALFINCVIYNFSSSWYQQTGSFTNCMFTLKHPPTTGTYSNCLFGVPYSEIFVNATGGQYTIDQSDLHLVPNSPGKNYGTDGTDIGIYGTAYPFKEGFVPYNPHISSRSVAPATDASGQLNISFKVVAQPY
jgi:hypothetical protein